MNQHEIIEIITTTETEKEADRIGRHLVREHLAACAQTSGPINSHYWWKGELTTSKEWQCRVKTTVEMYPKVEKAITRIHSYEIPQILAVPVVYSLFSYETWLKEELHLDIGDSDH